MLSEKQREMYKKSRFNTSHAFYDGLVCTDEEIERLQQYELNNKNKQQNLSQSQKLRNKLEYSSYSKTHQRQIVHSVEEKKRYSQFKRQTFDLGSKQDNEKQSNITSSQYQGRNNQQKKLEYKQQQEESDKQKKIIKKQPSVQRQINGSDQLYKFQIDLIDFQLPIYSSEQQLLLLIELQNFVNEFEQEQILTKNTSLKQDFISIQLQNLIENEKFTNENEKIQLSDNLQDIFNKTQQQNLENIAQNEINNVNCAQTSIQTTNLVILQEIPSQINPEPQKPATKTHATEPEKQPTNLSQLQSPYYNQNITAKARQKSYTTLLNTKTSHKNLLKTQQPLSQVTSSRRDKQIDDIPKIDLVQEKIDCNNRFQHILQEKKKNETEKKILEIKKRQKIQQYMDSLH